MIVCDAHAFNRQHHRVVGVPRSRLSGVVAIYLAIPSRFFAPMLVGLHYTKRLKVQLYLQVRQILHHHRPVQHVIALVLPHYLDNWIVYIASSTQ